MHPHFTFESDPAARSATCARILSSLPLWFGIPDSNAHYVAGVANLPFLNIVLDGQVVGFVSLRHNSARVLELYVLGIEPGQHRRGLGTAALDFVADWAIRKGYGYLEVKTLDQSRESEEYRRTRLFYHKNGFIPLDVLHNEWGPENPCLIMIKPLTRKETMNLFEQTIETDRLLLVPAALSDAEEIFRHFTTDITTYMYPCPADDIGVTVSFLKDSIRGMQAGTNFQLTVRDKTSREFLGCCGLHSLDEAVPELGIWIKKEAFGRHIGFETIQALTNWAVRQKRWEKVKYPVDKRNIPSRRIPERLGGTVVAEYRQRNMAGFELDEVEYEVSLDREHSVSPSAR